MNEDKQNWGKVKKVIQEEELCLGSYYSHVIRQDLKHLSFSLSRYKFVSKLLMYREQISVCELGCNEAAGAVMLQQNTDLQKYVGIDLDGEAICWNRENLAGPFEFIEANFLEFMPDEKFDAIISLDVIEHIQPEMEDAYCKVIVDHLKDRGGTAVIGTPNVTMDPYACEASKIGHINLYDQRRLYSLCRRFFDNVFIFNMNDEVVNTGFAPMSCYIFALCAGKNGGGAVRD